MAATCKYCNTRVAFSGAVCGSCSADRSRQRKKEVEEDYEQRRNQFRANRQRQEQQRYQEESLRIEKGKLQQMQRSRGSESRSPDFGDSGQPNLVSLTQIFSLIGLISVFVGLSFLWERSLPYFQLSVKSTAFGIGEMTLLIIAVLLSKVVGFILKWICIISLILGLMYFVFKELGGYIINSIHLGRFY